MKVFSPPLYFVMQIVWPWLFTRMKTAIHGSILNLKNPDVDLSKERIFFACVRRNKRLLRGTVIRSHGPLSALTQGLTLKICLCFTECLRYNSRYTHQYQLERRYGTEGKFQKLGWRITCDQALFFFSLRHCFFWKGEGKKIQKRRVWSQVSWQRTLSASVVMDDRHSIW